MSLQTEFLPLAADALPAFAARRKEDGWRFVQMLAVNAEDGIDLVYSFMKDGVLENHQIAGVRKGTCVPSITDEFLAAFVFENEAHDLFGVDIRGIAIDFGGKFYQLAQAEPMTIISPAQKAARDKAAKAAAAKAAKEASGGRAASEAADEKPQGDGMEAKLAGMDPEKAAKVRAAMEAKAARAAAAKTQAVEDKMKDLDPEKAAKVRAALEAKKEAEAAKAGVAGKEGE